MGNFVTIRDNLPVYISKPELKDNEKYPVVLLFMHLHGVDNSQQKICDDLAKAGYVAVAGDAYQNGLFGPETRSDEMIFEVFDEVLTYTKNMTEVDTNRLGVIGICMGGRHAYLANINYSEFKAAVAFYGFPHRGSSPEDTPQQLIDKFNSPVLSIFGELDKGIPMEDVNRYIKATEHLGHPTFVYPGAGHGFLNPDSNNHDADASKKAWKETLDHFKKHL